MIGLFEIKRPMKQLYFDLFLIQVDLSKHSAKYFDVWISADVYRAEEEGKVPNNHFVLELE